MAGSEQLRTPIEQCIQEVIHDEQFEDYFRVPPSWYESSQIEQNDYQKTHEVRIGESTFNITVENARPHLVYIDFLSKTQDYDPKTMSETIDTLIDAGFSDAPHRPIPKVILGIDDENEQHFDLISDVEKIQYQQALKESAYSEINYYFPPSTSPINEEVNKSALSSDSMYRFVLPTEERGPLEGFNLSMYDASNLNPNIAEFLLSRHRDSSEGIDTTDVRELTGWIQRIADNSLQSPPQY